MSKKPVKDVRAAVEKAVETEASEVTEARNFGPNLLRKKFKLTEAGLYSVKEDLLHWISAKFEIEAETRDEAGSWGLLVSWRDRDGAVRSEIFGRELFSGDCREVRNRLAAGGLTIAGDPRSRQSLVEYLNIVQAPARARCVERTGWHLINEKRVFVLPDYTIGDSPERVILQSAGKDRAPFGRKGDLAQWRDSIGRLASMNSRLLFCISAAFAGSLLDLSGEDGGGINLKGPSRVGKTTALRVAASVWGGNTEHGATAFIRSWRATGNGLESVACQHSDTLLCLDEMGQSESAEIGDISYMLANGSGKARATRDGGARAAARWRVLFLSTGEMGLADKNAEAKKATKAGQEIRLIDIAADAGTNFGLFEYLHSHETADQFAETLRGACRANFGTAGVAFLKWILEQISEDTEFVSNMRRNIELIVSDWLVKFADAGGQVRSVARRIALIGVAGEFATDAGITGWERSEATDAARTIFSCWLAERGYGGASEDEQAKRQLSAYIGKYGNSRFELWRSAKQGAQTEPEDSEQPPIEHSRTLIRAGFRKYQRDTESRGSSISFTYYLFDDAMKEALQGLDFRAAIRTLRSSGLIVPDKEGKSKQLHRLPGVGKAARIYVVPGHVIGFDHDAAATSD